VKYYDIKLDPDIMPMDPKKLAEMSRSALDLLHRELENIYRELEGSIGMIYAVGHAHIDVSGCGLLM
jgi:alpha-mannosidase